jgi:hypothetical protein
LYTTAICNAELASINSPWQKFALMSRFAVLQHNSHSSVALHHVIYFDSLGSMMLPFKIDVEIGIKSSWKEEEICLVFTASIPTSSHHL